MRKHIIIAALLAATTVTAPVLAQRTDAERAERRAERQAARAARGEVTEPLPQSETQERTTPVRPAEAAPQQRPEREFRVRQISPDSGATGDNERRWRERPAMPQIVTPPVSNPSVVQEQRRDRDGQDRRWDGNRNDGDRANRDGRGWRDRQAQQPTPPVVQDGRRRWDRNGDGRPDVRIDDGRNRDWSGNRDARRSDGWRNDDRRPRNWSRDWRRDRQYDWQRYRTYNRDYYHLPRYRSPYGYRYGYQRFGIGIYLNQLLFSRSYWIDDPYSYRLPHAYPPYRWVRYYDDALLIDERSGYVVDVIHDIFY